MKKQNRGRKIRKMAKKTQLQSETKNKGKKTQIDLNSPKAQEEREFEERQQDRSNTVSKVVKNEPNASADKIIRRLNKLRREGKY